MKKELKQSLALLVILSMLLSMLGGLNVFAETSETLVVDVSETFDDGVQSSYDDINITYNSKGKAGTASVLENGNPAYGKMFAFAQTAYTNKNDNSIVNVNLNNPVDGASATENQYTELSVDLDVDITGSNQRIDIISHNADGTACTAARITVTHTYIGIAAGATYVAEGAANSCSYSTLGFEEGYDRNIRVVLDFKNKKVKALYVDDVKAICAVNKTAIADVDIPLLNSIDTVNFSWGNGIHSVGPGGYTFAIDNLNIVTYTSADGTSPLANKAALREKLAEFTGMDLSGAAKTTLDSAVAVAVNPIATQTAVNEAITALENINTAGVPAVVAFEDFEGGADGVYNNFSYATTKNASYATIKTIPNSNPVLNKAFGLLQASTGAKANTVIGTFTLKDTLDYSNATEGQYAEISFDLRTQVESSTLAMAMYDSNGTLLGQVNVGAADIRTGVGYTADTDKVGTYAQAGLSEGYDKNIRLIVDLKNHQTDAIYVDGVRILDSTDAHNPITNIDFAESTVNNIAQLRFNWCNGNNTGDEYTFLIDNLRVMTYNTTSPENNKAMLIKSIKMNYGTADATALANAVSVYKNIFATETEIEAAAKSLYPAISTYLSKIVVPQSDVYVDKLEKTDLSQYGIDVTYSSTPEGYIDENLNVYQPTERSVEVTITYTLTRYDETATTTKTVTVHPRASLEINEIIFTDATGATVYSPQTNGTLKSVNLTKYSDKDVKLYVAVYEDSILKTTKVVDAVDGELNIGIPVNANSTVRFFVWEDKSIKPLQLSRDIVKGSGRIHIIADSIYADYSTPEYMQYAPDYGIGQALSAIFAGKGVVVNNAAVPGSHTQKWYNEFMMDSILGQIKQGDYVIISL